ncbi:MAG: hypothetical protein KDH88_05605 [Chromatiales bacterium]|nr:hypothetical protein [Chromatiales bacterium]
MMARPTKRLFLLTLVLALASFCGNAQALSANEEGKPKSKPARSPDTRIRSAVVLETTQSKVMLQRDSLPLADNVKFYYRDGASLHELPDLAGYRGKPATLKTRDGKVVWIVVGPREGNDVSP